MIIKEDEKYIKSYYIKSYNDKIEIIKENKEFFIKSLNSYLDSIYNLVDNYFDENGNLKEGLTPDIKIETFIKGFKDEAQKFEKVRRKLIDNDFNLSLFEVNLIVASLIFIMGVLEKDIDNFTKRLEEVKDFIKKLSESSK